MIDRRTFLASAPALYRWGQTNITEDDPPRYDIEWWRK